MALNYEEKSFMEQAYTGYTIGLERPFHLVTP